MCKPVKMWHDDVRKPPDESWIWVRTNDAARELLTSCYVVECSLDHDMGHDYIDVDDEEDAIYLKGDSEDDGTVLVKWMIDQSVFVDWPIPPKVCIHSWNFHGAKRMASLLRQYCDTQNIDIELSVQPYEV